MWLVGSSKLKIMKQEMNKEGVRSLKNEYKEEDKR